jgi:hypothetical protein
VFSFIGIATVVQDPCPDYVKNSNIGKYISNESILSVSVYDILNTENGACNMHDYPIIQIEK